MSTATPTRECVYAIRELDALTIEMTPARRRCADVLMDTFGPPRHWYAWPNLALAAHDHMTGPGFELLTMHSMATFDGAELTRLVVAAHRHNVRVDLSAWSPHTDELEPWMPKLAMHQRRYLRAECGTRRVEFDRLFPSGIIKLLLMPYPEGSLWDANHPGLDDLAKQVTS